ncbi:MAG TPA: glycosyltransferase family 2 protein [Chitinophagales bacterium]|nr:glycosyltransferase family 2 protein [Chitinophagales bacterium]
MNQAKKVAVVILSWNGKKFLEQFLPSVVQHTSAQLCEIIVADNQSSDGSIEFLQQHYPNVRIIQNPRNGGYAGGYNDALKHVNAEYYVLLNQDIEVTANWVERVIAEMDKDKNIAAAQPKLRDFYRREYFEYAGASGGYLDRNSYAFCRGRLFNTIEKDEGQYDDVKEIFWATGACLFVRNGVYWQAGALDEDFFAHQEEIDLCWRMRNMGYKIICVPSSVIYHVGGGSLPQGNPRKTYLNFRNNLMMMFKNLPASTLLPKMLWRMVLDGIAAFHSISKNKNFKDFQAILKAHFSFYAAIPALLEKRKRIPHASSVHLTPINILWQYFFKGRKKYSDLPE